MILMEGRITTFAILILISAVIVYLILRGRGGRVPKLRRLPSLDAIEEAVGRAVEMGRPVVYSTGLSTLSDANSAQTLASLDILDYVANLSVSKDAKLVALTPVPTVLPVMQEIVKSNYRAQNKLEEYREDEMVRFLSDQQFAYAAGALGVIHRENAAAHILMGAFWAESLLIAEAAYKVGAIQVGGTANTHQVPFIITVCDYALIGEELLAAGAYLSEDPAQAGSIAGQDFGKILAIVLILLGMILATVGSNAMIQFLGF